MKRHCLHTSSHNKKRHGVCTFSYNCKKDKRKHQEVIVHNQWVSLDPDPLIVNLIHVFCQTSAAKIQRTVSAPVLPTGHWSPPRSALVQLQTLQLPCASDCQPRALCHSAHLYTISQRKQVQHMKILFSWVSPDLPLKQRMPLNHAALLPITISPSSFSSTCRVAPRLICVVVKFGFKISSAGEKLNCRSLV